MTQNEAALIDDESIKRVVKQTVAILEQSYATHVSVIQFTQGRHKSWARDDRRRGYVLNFGLPMIRIIMAGGSKHHPRTRGWESVVSVATHEFAHAFQYECGLIDDEDVSREAAAHDSIFFGLYEKMMALATTKVHENGVISWK